MRARNTASEMPRQISFDPHLTARSRKWSPCLTLISTPWNVAAQEGNHAAVPRCQHPVNGALHPQNRALICPGVISKTGSAKLKRRAKNLCPREHTLWQCDAVLKFMSMALWLVPPAWNIHETLHSLLLLLMKLRETFKRKTTDKKYQGGRNATKQVQVFEFLLFIMPISYVPSSSAFFLLRCWIDL